MISGCASQASKYFSDGTTLQVANAAANGNAAKVQALRDGGADINAQGKDGVTPLLWALAQGNKIGVQKLLELGANPNHQTDDGDSMMSLASQMRDSDFLKLALKYGGNPNLKMTHYPYTPLMQAIGPENFENITLLVEAGADVNYQDPITGDTPVISAADLNQYDIVYYLIQQGADYRLKNKFGNTIVFAIEHNNIDPYSTGFKWRQKVIEFLESHGITVHPKPNTPMCQTDLGNGATEIAPCKPDN